MNKEYEYTIESYAVFSGESYYLIPRAVLEHCFDGDLILVMQNPKNTDELFDIKPGGLRIIVYNLREDSTLIGVGIRFMPNGVLGIATYSARETMAPIHFNL